MQTLKPNLFIPGAAKSGTSSLHQLLDLHPEICMSTIKEPHFWTKLNYDKYTNEDYKNYESLFEHKQNVKYFGESSTGYFVFPFFKNRIKLNYKTEPKFILILRNPIDRCYSHYWWLKGMGSEKYDLKTAFLNDINIEPRPEVKLPESNYKCYYQYGLYAKWLEKYYVFFDPKNIKIITQESLKTKRLETLNECFNFLELDSLKEIPEIHTNKTVILKRSYLYKYAKLITYNKIKLPQLVKDYMPNKLKLFIRKHLMSTILKHTKTDKTYPKIDDSSRLFLKDYYKDDVSTLKEITGLSFIEWTDFND